MQLSKEEGGLNLVDLLKKDKALKATWPKILKDEPDYAGIIYGIMRCKTLGEDIWRCSLNEKDIDNMRFQNEFWKDVLKSWSSYNYYYGKRYDNQILWYNSEIRVAGKPVMWNDVYEKGLRYVHQLFQDNGFKTEETVCLEYGLTPLRYNSLKVAIPSEWKVFFLGKKKIQYMPIPPHNYDNISLEKSLSRKVYRYIGEDRMLVHSKFLAWRIELEQRYEGTLSDFVKSIRQIPKISNVPKYRSFQYRLLQRGVVTNIHLYKWQIIEDDLCTFCKEHKETYSHIFSDCHYVKDMWKHIQEKAQMRYQISVCLNSHNIIFDAIVPTRAHVVNFWCLITKQYIYKTEMLGYAFKHTTIKY